MNERHTTIKTSQGDNPVLIMEHGQHVQYNCFMPAAGGAGVFALFDQDVLEVVQKHAFRAILEAGPHPEHTCLRHITGTPVSAQSVNLISEAAIDFVLPQDATDCADCTPTGQWPRQFTAEDYQIALQTLEEHHGLNDEQRQQARDTVDDTARKSGVID